MVSIFVGSGAGFARGSGNILGGAGLLGSGAQGRSGDNVSVNAATGNLLIARQDEFLVARGPDVGVSRTYNSLAQMSDGDNSDNWQQSTMRRVFGLSGTLNTAGSTVKRQGADGSVITYTWDTIGSVSAYWTTDGDGAHEKLEKSGSAWVWTDGSSRYTETYESWYGDATMFRIKEYKDNVGYKQAFAYEINSNRLYRITTQNDAIENLVTGIPEQSYIEYYWDGDNNIDYIITGYTDYGANIDPAAKADDVNKTLTRTRYTYDVSNRLSTVTVDLSPDDQIIADGKTYVTTYTYDGDSLRVASITQTDGSSLAISYDGAGRVATLMQTVAAGEAARTTSFTYGINQTSITGPDLKVTRLDYAGDNLAPPSPFDWNSGDVIKEAAGAIDGDAAVKFTATTGSTLSVVSIPASSIANGDVVTFALSLKAASGAATSQSLGLYGSVTGWGTGGSTARIVSGPGTLVQTVGGLWQVNGLSATEATRIEITRTYTQSETVSATFYVDRPGGFRDGQQLIAAGAVVTKNATPDGSFRQLTQITAPAATTGATPQTVRFEYYDDGNLKKIIDSANQDSNFTYDAMGNMLTSTDANGNVITRTYGAKNEMLTEARVGVDSNGSADTHITRYIYDSNASLRYVISAENRVTEYRYSYGQLSLQVSYPEQPYTGGAGNPTSAAMDAWRDALPDRSSIEISAFIYDNRGNLYYSTNYGAATSAGAASSAEGYSRTYFKYDQTGQMLSRQRVGEATETFLYDGMRRLVGSTDLAGGTTTIVFDDGAVKTTVTTGTGYTSISTFNKAGDLVNEEHSGAGDEPGISAYRYDALGRVRMITTPRGTATPGIADDFNSFILYDFAGRKTANIAADGGVIEYRYDAAGRLAATISYVNKLASAKMTALATAGGIAEISGYRPTSNPVDQWSWNIYDDGGRLIQSIDATGAVVDFDYDASDRLIRTVAYATKITVSGFVTTLPSTRQTVSASVDDRISRSFYDGDGRLIGVLDGEGYLTETLYDKAGRVTEEIAYATRTSSTYWLSGTFDNLRSSAAPTSTANRRLHYVYDGEGLLRFTVDNGGYVTGYSYNTANRPTATIAYATPLVTTDYTYDKIDDLLTGTSGVANDATDRESYTVYNDKGWAAFTIDAGGLVTAFTYDIGGRVTKTVQYAVLRSTTTLPTLTTMNTWASSQALQAENRIVRNWYSAGGKLLVSVDAEGFRTTYEYDDDGNRIAVSVSPNAVSVSDVTTLTAVQGIAAGTPVTNSYAYDPSGRLEYATDGEGFITKYIWSGTGQQTSIIAAWGTTAASETRYVYDGAGRVLSETRGYGATEASTVQYQYTAFGEVKQVTDPLGKVTLYSYDDRGLQLTATDPLSGLTSYVYNGFGDLVKATDPRGGVTYRYYDTQGRATYTVDAGKYVSRLYYNGFGEVSQSVRYTTTFTATDATTTADLDGAFGAIVDALPANAAATIYTYDKRGRALTVTDAMGDPTTSVYNAFGELRTVTRAGATTSFDYNNRGLVKKTTDAEGWFESYGYDAYRNRTSVIAKSKDGAKLAGGTTTYVYDKRGLLLSETLPVSSYNADGSVQGVIVNSYVYDGRGNRTQMTEAAGLLEARTTTYEYDKLNRLTKTKGQARTILDQNGHTAFTTSFVPEEAIAYDAAGNVTRVTDAAGYRTVYFYDDLGRKTVEINALGAYTKHSYDANGNLTATRVYESPVAVPVNGGGTPPAPPAAPNDKYRETTFAYDNLNRLLSSTVSGVKTGSYVGSAWTGVTTPIVTAYEYDAFDNVVKGTDPNANITWSYYDKAGRKTHQVDAENYLTTWTYNADGNVLVETRYSVAVATPTSTTTLPSPPGTDTAKRITTFTYDNNGNRLSEARSNVLVHDEATPGTTTSVTATISWLYNGLGQVIRKTEATGDQTNYVYDAAGRVLTEMRASFSDFEDTTPTTSPNATPTVDYRYNGLGDVVRMVAAGQGTTLARETRYTYGGGLLLSTDTNAEGIVHEYFYDKRGIVIRDQYYRAGSAGGAGTLNAVLTKVDELGRTTEQSVAAWNGTAWVKGDVATTKYNGYGEIWQTGINGGAVLDANRLWQTENLYDGAGRVWATNAGDGVWKVFGYDKAGNQTIAIANAGYSLTGKTFDQAFAQISDATNGAKVNATYTVYDKRNMAKSVVEEGRQLLSTTDSQELATSRTYNAFGDVLTETNARGHVTSYSYNTIGKMTRSEGPTVEMVQENGAALWIKPSQDYYYDASGRLVATLDANGSYAAGGTSTNGTSKAANSGNLTRLTLLAGTGYDGGEALVTAETHADGGVKTIRYDVHGDARTMTDEVGRTTTQVFDRLGRLTQVNHAGGLIDYYAYDSLNQRTQHWNNLLTSSDKETTDYDVQGRVIATRAFGGDVTSTSYSWDATIAAISGVTTGGWTQVTRTSDSLTNLNAAIYKQSSDKSDIFGRVMWKEDLGGHDTVYAYDVAGRQTGATTETINTTTFTYYNSGLLATNSGPAGLATYTYDKAGNRLTELLKVGSVTIKNQSATYDALGRLISWNEAGTAKSPAALTTNAYDANGNIRRTHAEYRAIDATGTAASTATAVDYWFAYDSMNRVVFDRAGFAGTAGSGAIAGGTAYAYNVAGERVTAESRRMRQMTIWQPQQSYNPSTQQWTGGWVTGNYNVKTRETFSYDAAGRLATVYEAVGNVSYSGVLLVYADPVGLGNARATLAYDLMGRLTLQEDYGGGTDISVSGSVYSRSINYNAKSQVTSDEVISAKKHYGFAAYDLFKSVTTYGYGTGSSYALGSVMTQSAVNSTMASGSSSWTSDPSTLTTTSYAWWDGAVQDLITYDSNTGSSSNPIYTTDLLLNGFGQLTGADVNDGVAKDVAYTLDENGQIIRRDENRTVAPSEASPHEIFYRFAGKQMGTVGNNGTIDVNYTASVVARSEGRPDVTASNAGLFRDGTKTGASGYADFAQSPTPFNTNDQGSSGGVYTVRAGDTLPSIAANLYGDANLWYQIAGANGFSANSALIEGQTITLPTGVTRNTHSADTFNPYDPTDALGDLSPTTPKPPKKPKCGMFGQILVAAIAIGISLALPGGGTAIGGAINAAIGSAVAQGFGVATGIQTSFSWKGVALAAIGGGLSGGITELGQAAQAATKAGEALTGLQKLGMALGGNGIGMAIARGAGTNALTQGVSLATGLQSKFDFVGVAAAGAISGIGQLASNHIGGAAQYHESGALKGVLKSPASTGNVIASSAAGAIAGAATRSAITGESFGDNLMRVLPDVIANSLIMAGRSVLAHKGGNDGAVAGVRIKAGAQFASAGQSPDRPPDWLEYDDFDADNPITVTAQKDWVDAAASLVGSVLNAFGMRTSLGAPRWPETILGLKLSNPEQQWDVSAMRPNTVRTHPIVTNARPTSYLGQVWGATVYGGREALVSNLGNLKPGGPFGIVPGGATAVAAMDIAFQAAAGGLNEVLRSIFPDTGDAVTAKIIDDNHGKYRFWQDGYVVTNQQRRGVLVNIALSLPAGEAALARLGPRAAVAAERGGARMFSSGELMGVERASPDLIASVSSKRSVVIAREGSDELRMLDYFGAEASVNTAENGILNGSIILRQNPSKAAVLEEFLHGTQARLGITDRLGTSGLGSAETHVKDFMIRHQGMLGLGKEDVAILKILRDKGL